MKKIMFIAAFAVAAFAAVNVYHATVGSSNLSDLQLANLEALANKGESNNGKGVLYEIRSKRTGKVKGYCCKGSEQSNCTAKTC